VPRVPGTATWTRNGASSHFIFVVPLRVHQHLLRFTSTHSRLETMWLALRLALFMRTRVFRGEERIWMGLVGCGVVCFGRMCLPVRVRKVYHARLGFIRTTQPVSVLQHFIIVIAWPSEKSPRRTWRCFPNDRHSSPCDASSLIELRLSQYVSFSVINSSFEPLIT